MGADSSLFPAMLAIPALAGLAVYLLPQKQARRARPTAMVALGITFLLSLLAASRFDWSQHTPTFQFSTRLPWISAIHASFLLGVDALSMTFVLLTTATGMLACWASFGVQRMPRGYFALLLWLVSTTLGTLLSLDLLLFLVFFELTIIPVYLLVGGWGGGRKEYAASKYLLFALLSAIAFLIAIVLIARLTDTFDLTVIAGVHAPTARALFWTLVAIFGIRMAGFPLHTWLGDLLVEAPTPIAMFVAAVVTKLGAYGLLRIAWPLFAEEARSDGPILAWVGVAAIVYASLAALAQRDLRRIVAFGSVASMGYVLLGLASANDTARLGVTFALLAHAVWSAMLLFITGMIADRTGHCDLKRLGGLAGHMPAFAGWSAIAFLTAMGLPGLCGFVGELLIVMGVFASGSTEGPMRGDAALLGMMAALAMILTGACFLWTYQRVFLGAPKPEHSNVARLSRTEKWILAFLTGLSLLLGILPSFLLEALRPWIESH